MANYVYKKAPVRWAMGSYDFMGGIFMKKRPPRNTSLPYKIGFLALNQIGDVIMAVPTIEAIAAMFPKAQLTIVAGKSPTSLLQDNPWNAKVIVFDAVWQKVVRQFTDQDKTSKRSQDELLKIVENGSFDCLVIFHPDLVVNQVVGRTKIPHTFGFANAGGGFRLTNPLWMPDHGHQVERNFALAQAVASVFNRPLPKLDRPKMHIGKPMIQKMVSRLDKEGIDAKKLIVIHPFPSTITKEWDKERWISLAKWLISQKFTPVIIGGLNDQFSKVAGVRDWSGKFSLGETFAVLSLARLCIGVDSGPAHMAAAVGCPLISIFSSVHDPLRWAPYGDKAKTVVLYSPVNDRKKYPYEMRELPAGTVGNPYSNDISTAEVEQAVSNLLT